MCSSAARGAGAPKPQSEAISKPLGPNDDASFDVSNTEGTVRGSAVSKQCGRMKNLVPRVVSCVALVFVYSVLNANCTRSPHLTEYDEESNKQARSAPLVVVGVVDSDRRVGRPVPSRRDPSYPMQLHRARVQVENVLRGSVREQTFFSTILPLAEVLMVHGLLGLALGHPAAFFGYAETPMCFGWLATDGMVALCSSIAALTFVTKPTHESP